MHGMISTKAIFPLVAPILSASPLKSLSLKDRHEDFFAYSLNI
jgi:hypothetical protein